MLQRKYYLKTFTAGNNNFYFDQIFRIFRIFYVENIVIVYSSAASQHENWYNIRCILQAQCKNWITDTLFLFFTFYIQGVSSGLVVCQTADKPTYMTMLESLQFVSLFIQFINIFFSPFIMKFHLGFKTIDLLSEINFIPRFKHHFY